MSAPIEYQKIISMVASSFDVEESDERVKAFSSQLVMEMNRGGKALSREDRRRLLQKANSESLEVLRPRRSGSDPKAA